MKSQIFLETFKTQIGPPKIQKIKKIKKNQYNKNQKTNNKL